VTLPTPVLVGQDYLTATATGETIGTTSEFSPDLIVPAANLAPVTSQNLQTLLAAVTPAGGLRAVFLQAGASLSAATVLGAVNGLTNIIQPSTITLDLGRGTYPIGGVPADPPTGVNLVIQNGTLTGGLQTNGNVTLITVTLDPDYPALTVAGGQASVLHCILTTSGNAPNLLVTGGSLTLSNDDIIQASPSYTDPAIAVTGGTVNLGTGAAPGNNTLSVNATGDLVNNTTGSAISAVGDTFVVGGIVKPAPLLSFASLATSSPSTIPGQTAPFTATIAPDPPAAATPTGGVDFCDATTGTDLGTVALSGGAASLGTSALGLGMHVVRASYGGDANYLPSVALVTQTVTHSIYVLSGTASGAFSLSGSASINLPGAIVVDSNSRTALTESGNASVKAAGIHVVGGVSRSGNATLSPAVTAGAAAVADPLAGLTGPGTAGLTNYGAASYSRGAHTLGPAIYSQVSGSGNASLTLSPGLYLIEGGGFTVTGNASVTGAGVTVYNTSSNNSSNTGSYGGIALSGNGTFNRPAAAGASGA
jgi:hypothetical protein